MESLRKQPGERWTDKLGLDSNPISLEDTVSPEFYELEKEALFRRSWLFVGRVEQVPKPGDYFQINAFEIRVEEMDGPRVARLKISRRPAP